MDKEPITLNGLNKLKEELVFLKEKKRPEIVAAIAAIISGLFFSFKKTNSSFSLFNPFNVIGSLSIYFISILQSEVVTLKFLQHYHQFVVQILFLYRRVN